MQELFVYIYRGGTSLLELFAIVYEKTSSEIQ